MNNPIPMWTPFTPPIDETAQLSDIKFQRINVNQIAQSVFKAFEMVAKNKRLKLFFEAESDTDYFILGSEVELTHMITQMVKNSLAQTLEGFIKIRLLKTEDEVVVQVNDSGIGIHPNEKIAMVEVTYRGRLCRITHVQDPKTSMVLMANQLHSHNAHLHVSVHPSEGMLRRLALPIEQPALVDDKIENPVEMSLTY